MTKAGQKVKTKEQSVNIGMIDVDGHNYPNLALMKLSAWHKSKGDVVEWWNGLKHYDLAYQAKVFDETYSQDNEFVIMADKIIKGGTGYGLDNKLPDHIEHIYPDYSLYGIEDTAYGFLTRGCPRHCDFCIVGDKEGLKSHKVADLSEFWRGEKNIELLDPNLLACKDRNSLLEQLRDSKARVNFSQGLDARLMDEEVAAILNTMNIKSIHFAWDNYEFKTYEKLKMVKPLLNLPDYQVTVYVLTNYSTTLDEDLERITKLHELKYRPYVMIYDKPHAPKIIRKLQRWCNGFIYKISDFKEYYA